MNKCPTCKIEFKRGAEKVGCGICGNWFHLECANMSKDVWKLMSKETQIHWYCKKCNNIAPEVLQALQKCITSNVEIKKQIGNVKAEMKAMKEGKDETFNLAMKQIAKEVFEENIPVVKQIANAVFEENKPEEVEAEIRPEVVKIIARNEVHENNDKKGRERNIVISNLAETFEAEGEVEKILTYLDVPVQVEVIRRMGRERKPGKIRPIWVKLADKKERNAVLDKAKKLRDREEWKKVFINKDMTDAERTEAFNLRQELRERRRQEGVEQGRSKFVIHRGRVVNKENRPREPAQPRDGNLQQNERNQENNEEDRDAAEAEGIEGEAE